MNLLTKTVTNSKFWNLKLKIISTIFFAMTCLVMQNAKWRWKISIIWQAKGPAKRWEASGQILNYCLNRWVLLVCHKKMTWFRAQPFLWFCVGARKKNKNKFWVQFFNNPHKESKKQNHVIYYCDRLKEHA